MMRIRINDSDHDTLTTPLMIRVILSQRSLIIYMILNKRSPNLFQSQTTVNITYEKGNSDQGDKSPARISKVLSDQFSNAYGSLNKADGHGEHTYASLNKAGSEKNSNGGGNNNNNTGYIAMTAPLSNGGIGRSGDRSAGEVRKSKDSRSSDVISARAGKGGEVRKLTETLGLCSICTSTYLPLFSYKLSFRAQTVDLSLKGPLLLNPTLVRKAEKEGVRMFITHLSMMMYR